MTAVEAVLVFGGIPLLVVLLVALPIFGSDWVAWLRPSRRRQPPDCEASPGKEPE